MMIIDRYVLEYMNICIIIRVDMTYQLQVILLSVSCVDDVCIFIISATPYFNFCLTGFCIMGWEWWLLCVKISVLCVGACMCGCEEK